MSNFRFRGPFRVTLRALIFTMLPNEQLPASLPDDVLTRLEQLLRASAWYTRVAFLFGLFVIEYGSGILNLEFVRYSRLRIDGARRRFAQLSTSRIHLVVLLAKLMKSLLQIAIYSDARVEAHFGNQRRAWRADRFKVRNELVQLDGAQKNWPDVPEPLADPEVVSPETYLNWNRSQSDSI